MERVLIVPAALLVGFSAFLLFAFARLVWAAASNEYRKSQITGRAVVVGRRYHPDTRSYYVIDGIMYPSGSSQHWELELLGRSELRGREIRARWYVPQEVYESGKSVFTVRDGRLYP